MLPLYFCKILLDQDIQMRKEEKFTLSFMFLKNIVVKKISDQGQILWLGLKKFCKRFRFWSYFMFLF